MGKASKTKTSPSAVVKKGTKNEKLETINPPVSKEIVAEHLPPIGLVLAIIACSGFLLVFSFRDVFATGKIIGVDISPLLAILKRESPLL